MRVVFFSFMTLASICFSILSSAVYAQPEGAWIGPGLYSFKDPMYQGYRLDFCLEWGSKCGEPAASAWCKMKGYDRANNWKKATNIGSISPTKVFQTGQICNQASCDGFSFIVCDLREQGTFFDFIEKAAQAKWTNTWRALPFPGNPDDSIGFVRCIDNAQLEDDRTYCRVIQTHPQWRQHGKIIGHYSDITIPLEGAEFRAQIGFLKGAEASDGVYFEIQADFPDYRGIYLKREYHKKYSGHVIRDFRQDLSRFRGKTGKIFLFIDAGEKSAAWDWAVWVKPRLVSMKNKDKRAAFVGGAVGSGRSGKRLENAFGGKSGHLYGDVVLYLEFANLEKDYSLDIDSYYKNQRMSRTHLGTVKKGQTVVWHTLSRTQEGWWRERVRFNGGHYLGDVRYNISKIGE
ncbi:MAG: hypothetical protein JSV88_05365 [Candidatus Aminicenantes bacterium]|nr:MAG: hypothetical protein JSV88_05365 [Candidatus Aminicenantes bacterium]